MRDAPLIDVRCSGSWMWLLVLGCGDLPLATSQVAGAEPPPSQECTRDDECVLLPTLSCCGECPPAPPFSADPRSVLDGMLIESETTCAADTRPCTRPVCERVPETCVARAVCASGRCNVVATGCGRPTS